MPRLQKPATAFCETLSTFDRLIPVAGDPMRAFAAESRLLLRDELHVAPRDPSDRQDERPAAFGQWIECGEFRLAFEGRKSGCLSFLFRLFGCDFPVARFGD